MPRRTSQRFDDEQELRRYARSRRLSPETTETLVRRFRRLGPGSSLRQLRGHARASEGSLSLIRRMTISDTAINSVAVEPDPVRDQVVVNFEGRVFTLTNKQFLNITKAVDERARAGRGPKVPSVWWNAYGIAESGQGGVLVQRQQSITELAKKRAERARRTQR